MTPGTWKAECFDKYIELLDDYGGRRLEAEEIKTVNRVIKEYSPRLTRERFIEEFKECFPENKGIDDPRNVNLVIGSLGREDL